MGLKARPGRSIALCWHCRKPQRLHPRRRTVFAHNYETEIHGKMVRGRCLGSKGLPLGRYQASAPFKPATFYYVKGSDGSMALYYKAGTEKAMHASASHAELSADEIDPKLYLKMKVSDKFAAIKGLPVDGRTPGQIFDDSLRSRFPGF